MSVTPGSGSVLGGIYLVFSCLSVSSISLDPDVTYAAGTGVTGAFGAPFALFGNHLMNGTYGNLVFSSPMPKLIADIREIMFRSSIAIVERSIGDDPKNATTSLGE